MSPQIGELDQMGGETQVLVVGEGLWVEVDELMLRGEQREQPGLLKGPGLEQD